MDGIHRDLSRSNSQMIKHYVSPTERDTLDYAFRYREAPIWVAVEVMSFGRITNMLTYMKDPGPARCVTEAMGVHWK
ncbi:Abi family protein [Bifidobacterium subtile]|uniref:Abi family protein n=1 Tax=Bifidobacterium subtile TaxID=77635 RepID=UPI0039C88E59